MDTQWYTIDELPLEAKVVEKQFIAASERTGSFHALFGDYTQYEVEGGFCIDVKDECILNHSLKEHLMSTTLDKVVELPKKDHRHSTIPKGLYYVGIQTKHDPLVGLRKRVID